MLGSHAVTVDNVAPSAQLDGVDSIDEGGTYSLSLSGSDPAGVEDTLSYAIDWGDGSAVQNITAAELATLGGSVDHVFADDEDGPINATDRLIEVTVSDEDGGSSSSSRTVTVNNVAPIALIAGAAMVDTGATYQLNIGAITDPGTDTVTDYLVDWGDGSSDSYTAAELATLGGTVEHTYADLGDKSIAVTATDEDGAFALGAVDLTVEPLPDTVSVNAGGPTTLDEGDTFNRTITFTDGEDTDNDGWTYSIDWDGDGNADETGAIAAGTNAFDISRVFADGDATETVTVTVEDGPGETDSGSFEVTVNNVAPVAEVTGADSVDEGSEFTLNVGALTDPGDDTPTAYQIDWGDGTVEDLTPAEWAAATGILTHTYADGSNGGTPYTIDVRVTDEDGTFVLGSHAVTVTDAPNVAPTANPIDAGSVQEDGSVVSIDLLVDAGASDSDGGTLDVSDVTVKDQNDNVVAFGLAGALLTINPAQFAEALNTGDRLTLNIRYNVTDGQGGVTPNTGTLVINGLDGPYTWYLDSDADGFGVDDAATNQSAYEAPAGTSNVAGDADDSDPMIYPDAPEINDYKDNDQDGFIDEDNSNPVANGDAATVDQDGSVAIPVADLLANDTDTDGDSLSVSGVSNAVNGTVLLDDKGDADATNDEVVFTPHAG